MTIKHNVTLNIMENPDEIVFEDYLKLSELFVRKPGERCASTRRSVAVRGRAVMAQPWDGAAPAQAITAGRAAAVPSGAGCPLRAA